MGLFSKIFKGIKKVVKGVAKVIKKTVKGVAKVVKKVAKSKIFKAVLAAAAIYVTGGAALSSFGTAGTGLFSSTGAFGKWATQYGSGIFSSGIGKAVATPFHMLGSALGTGASAVTDFTGITEPNLLDASKSFPIGDPANYDPNIATGATNVATDAVVDAGAKGSGFTDYFKKETIGGTVVSNVVSGVGTGYIMSKLTEEDPTGQMSGLALEGPSNLDPLAIYGQNGQPLSIAEAYGQLLYGTADPMYNQGNTSNLYTQDIAPVSAA